MVRDEEQRRLTSFSFYILVAFGLRHNLDAYIFFKGSGGAAEEFEDISYWVNVMKGVDFAIQVAIGDAILVRAQCF